MDGWMDMPASIWNRQGGINQKRKKVFVAFLSPAGLLLVALETGFVDVSSASNGGEGHPPAQKSHQHDWH